MICSHSLNLNGYLTNLIIQPVISFFPCVYFERVIEEYKNEELSRNRNILVFTAMLLLLGAHYYR
jgi:hypothetical protein